MKAIELQSWRLWRAQTLTLIVRVEFGFELFHLPLVSEQQRPVFPQGPHPVLLLLLRHLLNEGVLLVVGDS